MSRYAGYPPWVLATKAAILAVWLPVMLYGLLCNFLSLHYRMESEGYSNAGLAIADRWLEDRNVNARSICEVERYDNAAMEAAHYRPFNAWWLMRNWRTDFLAKQPECK